jgi:hypothetical protein
MQIDETPRIDRRYTCRKTVKWLDEGRVDEKREFFRLHREDAERPDVVTRRERVVTFYSRVEGHQRIDNAHWYSTNDPAERERLRGELEWYMAEKPASESPCH